MMSADLRRGKRPGSRDCDSQILIFHHRHHPITLPDLDAMPSAVTFSWSAMLVLTEAPIFAALQEIANSTQKSRKTARVSSGSTNSQREVFLRHKASNDSERLTASAHATHGPPLRPKAPIPIPTGGMNGGRGNAGSDNGKVRTCRDGRRSL